MLHPKDETVDCVVDKATLDALMCVEEESDETAQRMLDEAWRVLKPGGRYVCISNSNLLSCILAEDDEGGRPQRRWRLEAGERLRNPAKRQSFWMGVFRKNDGGQ